MVCDEPRNVYWLGGSPCAGKSSVATRLAEIYALELVRVDECFDAHAHRFTATEQPALTTWLAGDCWERWLKPTAALVADVTACYAEHFAFVLTDVVQAASAPPPGRRMLVEGTTLLPALVEKYLRDPHHGMWLVPTATFQRQHYSRRPWIQDVLAGCEDRAAAFDGWMARDAAFARQIVDDCRQLELRCDLVDGAIGIDAQAALIAAWFDLSVS